MVATRETQMLDIGGGRRFGLAVYGAENGVPILALHGAPASRFMFDVSEPIAHDLGLTLYCPDRPGYGRTPSDDAPSLNHRVEDLVRVADALRLERFLLLGVSGGAPYATAMAAKLKTRIIGLSLVSPIGPVAEWVRGDFGRFDRVAMSAGHRWFFLSLPKRPLLLGTGGRLVEAAFRISPHSSSALFRWFLGGEDKRILSVPVYKRSKIRMTREALHQGIAGGAADLRIFSKPWGVDYRAITAPCVLWQGTADRIVPPAAAWALGTSLPNCKVVRLPGAGHFWVYENIREVLGTLKSAMQQPGDGPTSAS